jgi:hypothetical protein
MGRRPVEPNRMNSQEWSAYLGREQENESKPPPDALDLLIQMLEAGRLDPSDPRLDRLRRLLAESGRS